jgi:hypothetical protein
VCGRKQSKNLKTGRHKKASWTKSLELMLQAEKFHVLTQIFLLKEATHDSARGQNQHPLLIVCAPKCPKTYLTPTKCEKNTWDWKCDSSSRAPA